MVVPPIRTDISGDVVLVTNAGRGIGRRLAVRFGLEAGLVVCWDRDHDRCMNTVYEVRHRGGRAVGYAVDVVDEAAVVAGAAVLRRDVGHVRVLVLCAGRLPVRPLLRFTVADVQALWHSNVLPHFVLLKVFVPPMVTRNLGHVVCISSASSILPSALEGPYVATKTAVSGMVRGLREELASLPHNKVRVTCVYPCLPPQRSLGGVTHKYVLKAFMVRPDPGAPVTGASSDAALPSAWHWPCCIRWGQHSLDAVARQVVDGVLHGQDSISAPRCLVFWMRLIRLLPLSVQRRWRRLFLRRLHVAHANAHSPELQHAPQVDMNQSPRIPWSQAGTQEWRLSLDTTGPRPTPQYEMVTERSSSYILPIGFRKTRSIQLP